MGGSSQARAECGPTLSVPCLAGVGTANKRADVLELENVVRGDGIGRKRDEEKH